MTIFPIEDGAIIYWKDNHIKKQIKTHGESLEDAYYDQQLDETFVGDEWNQLVTCKGSNFINLKLSC